MIKYSDSPYSARRMKTAQDRLRFALDFAQADLSAMREGSKMNLRDDLYLFAHGVPLSRGGFDIHPETAMFARPIAAREIPNEALEALQKEFLKILQNVSLPEPRSRLAHVGPLPSLSFNVGEGIVFAAGDVQDVLIYTLMRVIESDKNAKRLQLCPACQRIFMKVKRQKYCSQKCANRAYMRLYRAQNGESISETNHKSYEKRTKKRIGKPVKIARRPRRK